VAGLATCTTPDLANPATNPSALWVDGMLIGSDGEGELDSFVGVGLDGAPGEVVFGPGPARQLSPSLASSAAARRVSGPRKWRRPAGESPPGAVTLAGSGRGQ